MYLTALVTASVETTLSAMYETVKEYDEQISGRSRL